MRPYAVLIGGVVCLMVSGPASADLLDQVASAKIHACDTNQFLSTWAISSIFRSPTTA